MPGKGQLSVQVEVEFCVGILALAFDFGFGVSNPQAAANVPFPHQSCHFHPAKSRHAKHLLNQSLGQHTQSAPEVYPLRSPKSRRL